ncbi:hypothetical protein [Streptomyces sp. NPDC051636]|uniref:hypothetical protein n=1 Tax=Streptomyces sp. NPDC051636 TaxID=3365663 RepID=UPI003789C686
MTVHKAIRAGLPDAVPFRPLGLPGWADTWVALGLRAPGATCVPVWRGGGEDEAAPPVRELAEGVRAEVLHTAGAGASAEWDGTDPRVRVPEAPGMLPVRLA